MELDAEALAEAAYDAAKDEGAKFAPLADPEFVRPVYPGEPEYDELLD